jgi:hypothetical protein
MWNTDTGGEILLQGLYFILICFTGKATWRDHQYIIILSARSQRKFTKMLLLASLSQCFHMQQLGNRWTHFNTI